MADRQPPKPPEDEGGHSLNNEEEEDFASMFETSRTAQDHRVQRDTLVEGTVVSIGGEWVFVDVGEKTEGAVARDELLDDEGNFTAQVGDTISAYVVERRDGDILLSMKMTSAASDEAVQNARQSGVPVEGYVRSERKGGYTVSLLGKDAFCPHSQIDLPPVADPQEYVDKRFTFRVIEYSERGRNIVVSRRELLEEERAKQAAELRKTLQPGDVVEGTVKNLTDFGAFVDIGGVEGLIPMSELAWYRVGESSDVLTSGEKVVVKVLDIDWDRRRVSLSRKQLLEDPWTAVAAKYPEGTTHSGVVRKLMDFGAFVELEPGVDGLIHVSKMGGGRRINHPREALDKDQTVEVTILSVDQQSRRIGLELNYAAAEEQTDTPAEIKPGDVMTGTVDAVKDYGVFVDLGRGRSGLLHVSEIGDARRGELQRRFEPGTPVEVEILDIDAESGKIALSAKSLAHKTEEAQFKKYAPNDKEGGSFGTLGDILKDKLSS